MSGAEWVSHNEAHNSLQHCRRRPTGGLLVYTRPAYSVVSRKGWHKMTAKQDLSSSGCWWWWWWSGGVEWLTGWLTAGDDDAIWNGSSSIEFYFYYFNFIHLMKWWWWSWISWRKAILFWQARIQFKLEWTMVARRHINIWRRMPDHYLCGGRRWLDAVQFGSQAKKPRETDTHISAA